MKKRKKCLVLDKTKNYNRCRQKSPSYFDKESFRTKKINKTTKIIIGCKKGEYNRKSKRCKIGTEIQSILTKR